MRPIDRSFILWARQRWQIPLRWPAPFASRAMRTLKQQMEMTLFEVSTKTKSILSWVYPI
jgi:hypothetical protein